MAKDRVVIFGRGKYCDFKIDSIKEKYHVIGFLDNRVEEKKILEDLEGVKICNPSMIHIFSNCIFICMSADFIGMYNQLKELNISDENIEFGVHFAPHFTGIDKFAFSDGQRLIKNNGKLLYKDTDGKNIQFSTKQELENILRLKFNQRNSGICDISRLPVKPYSRVFGLDRGSAVDRIYIENFLEAHKSDVKGIVMEIASSSYIERFGEKRVDKKIVLHVKGWGKDAMKGNLETGEGLTENMVDCLICTQTLQYIYNLKDTAKNIYKILKPGGVALITVPGIEALSMYDDENWGEKWSFTPKSLSEIFNPVFGSDNVEINSYGNVKIAVAYLYGLCAQDLNSRDFDYNDEMYPFLLTVRVKRR